MLAIRNLAKAFAGTSLFEGVSMTVNYGDRVALVGFGSFSVSQRAARTGRNPQTDKEIKIAAKRW